jgi:hypothetical protein
MKSSPPTQGCFGHAGDVPAGGPVLLADAEVLRPSAAPPRFGGCPSPPTRGCFAPACVRRCGPGVLPADAGVLRRSANSALSDRRPPHRSGGASCSREQGRPVLRSSPPTRGASAMGRALDELELSSPPTRGCFAGWRIQLIVTTPRTHEGVGWCVVSRQRTGRCVRSWVSGASEVSPSCRGGVLSGDRQGPSC